MKHLSRTFVLLSIPLIQQLHAQSLSCVVTTVPLTVRTGGIAERTGDILLDCSNGAPSGMLTGNFSIFLNTAITNRLSGVNNVDVVFTYDDGAGPQPVGVPAIFNGGVVSFNGAQVPLSPTGSVGLRFANIRADATQIPANGSIIASLAINGANILPLNQNQVVVGTPQAGLFDAFSTKLLCEQRGSPVPSTLTLSAFLAAGTSFSSTRLTEGFASSFEPLGNQVNFDANTGERFLITYSNFPAVSNLFVPDVVAGSDAVTPTSGGDLGLAPSGGQYAPSLNGTLLLARVEGADATGTGGKPVYTPGPIGSGTVSFGSLTQVPLTNGVGTVTYEVVDANAFAQESAQFPTFLGLAPDVVQGVVETSETVMWGPLSTEHEASATAPIPRFIPVTPGPDCMIVGDCGASYYPKLATRPTSLTFSTTVGGKAQSGFLEIENVSGGVLVWAATIDYPAGAPGGWLSMTPVAGIGPSSMYVYATPVGLAAGVYQATINIQAGLTAGQVGVPVTLNVKAAAVVPPAAPSVASVTSGANFHLMTVAPGSLATIFGAHFTGTQVSVSVGGLAATIVFHNDSQINFVVPSELVGQTSSNVVVTVDGLTSAAMPAKLAPFAPAIFTGGVLNQNGSPNVAKTGAAPGSVLQIFATGLSGTGTITATLGPRTVTVLEYAGPAPGIPGVQQVNLQLPADQQAGTVQLSVCGPAVCSAAVPVYVK